MKYAVIDIGSNSVRLMISVDGVTQTKYLTITKLAHNMDSLNNLSKDSVERTVRAVSFYVDFAKDLLVDKTYVFATAAVRRANNKQFFLDEVFNRTGVLVDVITGEKESQIGAVGALLNRDGAIIDIGGASTEIAAIKCGDFVYSKSLDIGVVRATDKCGQSFEKVLDYASEIVDGFGVVQADSFYSIGGTATSLASLLLELEVYDPKIVNGFVITKRELLKIIKKLYSLTIDERKLLKGLQPERAEVIPAGAVILLAVMQRLNIDSVIVSESDNLEGYLISKMEEI